MTISATGSPRKQNPYLNSFLVAHEYIVWLRQTIGQQSVVAQLSSTTTSLSKKQNQKKLKLKWKLVI